MPRFAAPARALLREVSDSFSQALQHAAYAQSLREAGVQVELLPADGACPDCCFVEDVAVILSAELGVASRPGAISRRAEVSPVAQGLREAGLSLTTVQEPGTLDGGDVLRAGQRLFVGLSSRTNRAGLEQLSAAAREAELQVLPVPLAQGLHLKSAVTLLDPETVVLLAGALDPEPFRASGLDCVEVDEPAGANVLALGDVVLVSSAAPRAAERLAGRGVCVRLIEVDELHKADGALTCLSLRLPDVGSWCV